MTESEAAAILRAHNEWRRFVAEGCGPPMVAAGLLSEAIEVAVRVLVNHREAMAVLRMIAERKRRTKEQRLAFACVAFLDCMDKEAGK